MLDKLIQGKQRKARKTVLYGIEGIGKSTFMSHWPNAVFISTEDGLADIDCTRFPEAKTFTDITGAITELYTQEHNFKTVVIDSIEGLQRLIFAKVAAEHNKESIEDLGYGKGYVYAVDAWEVILKGLDALNKKGIHIGLIGHAKIERFENPEGESFDRYNLRVHKHAVEPITEWATEVLFCTWSMITRTEDSGFGKTKAKPVGDGQRIIRTTARPAFRAKNRIDGLPAELPLDFSVYKDYLKLKESPGKK